MENCNKIEQMVIDGTITTDIAYELSNEVQEHINSCNSCKTFVTEIKTISHALLSAEKLTVSDSFDEQLQMKLAKHREHTSITEVKNVSIFTRMTYYVAGVAAVLLGFFYISNMNIVDDNGLNLDQNVNVASTVEDSSILLEDSLESLKESVVNDEGLRNRVSTESE
ncbi:MAG: hypothetical protein GQ534_04050 [Candidatus Delongbacteria bacterium]|nr:hypothetical protein [Candidatus Delongbacteria bacterium]